MPTPIFTIGHGSRTFEEFIDLIQNNQIDYVIDVRSQPYSQYNPVFSKGELEKQFKSENIQYVYMGDLLGGRPMDQKQKKSAFCNYQVGLYKPELEIRKAMRFF